MSGPADGSSASRFGPHEQARLARILAMLSSPYEHERAAAGLLASVFLTRHGLAWADIIGASPDARPGSDMSEQKRERRRNRRTVSRTWRGYCRRRRLASGQSVDLLA